MSGRADPRRQALPGNALKDSLRARRRSIGGWLTLASATATEIMAEAGFDWLLLDMEHAPVEIGDVAHHLRAAARAGIPVAVRPPAAEPVVTKRLLDIGVTSLMFPMIADADAARAAVAATRYPPAGIRGVAGTMRASGYGRVADYHAICAQSLCVIVQLETPGAIAAAGAIAATEGVDAVFVGPNDLAAAMGHLGQPDHPAVRTAIDAALGEIHAQGKAAGILDFGAANARGRLTAGFDFVAVAGDAALLARASETLAGELADIRRDA